MPRKKIDVDNIALFIQKNEPGDFEYSLPDREYDGLVLFTSGKGTLNISGCKYPIEKGSLLLFRSHDDYRIITDGPCSYITSFYTIRRDYYDDYLLLPRVINCDNELYNLIMDINEIWQSRSWDSYMLCKIKLMQLFLGIMTRIQCDLEIEDKDVRKAIEYIHKNFKRNFTMAELSEYCTISPSYLRTKFHKYVKATITQYRDSLRIVTAKELLKSQAYSVNAVAEELGYFDVSHFSKAFLRRVGMTPAEYKASKRIK